MSDATLVGPSTAEEARVATVGRARVGGARESIHRLVQSVVQRDDLFLALILGLYLVSASLLALDRSYIGHHENDFVKFFIPEATRFLEGEPLLSRWHPPLYAMVLGATYQVLGNWLAAGLMISLLAGAVALAASYRLFLNLAGRPAAWGAVLTLLGSSVFVQEATRASGDAFFLSLFLGACLLAVEAGRSGSRVAWCACGIVVGLALVTRTNAPPLLLLCIAPLFCRKPARSSVLDRLWTLMGVAIPILAMLWYASASGSNVLPSSNHINLAASYFAPGDDRSSTDAANAVAERFDNITEMVLHDPALIIKTYILDLYKLLSTNIVRLVEPPLNLMFLPGIIFLLAANRSRLSGLLAFVVVAETLLVNFKPFETRYYLFLIPLIGAAVGEIVWRIVHVEWSVAVRRALVALFAVMFVIAGGLAAAKTRHISQVNVAELAEVVPVARHLIGNHASIVSRKPNLAFYAEAEWLFMPDLDSVEDMETFLRTQGTGRDLYLLYGQVEQRYRGQYADLLVPGQAPAWLDVVAASNPPGRWVLYQYRGAP